jgi:hypothetical protein
LIWLFRADDLRQPMSAANSAPWFCEPAINVLEPVQTVAVLPIAIRGQDRLSLLQRLRGRVGVARVLILAVYDEDTKVPPIQTAGAVIPRKICQQTANPKSDWIHAVVWTLLAGCCALTLFFAFQAPFRLRANENQTSTVGFRAEIAALPASLRTQTMSRSWPNASDRGGGYGKEVPSSSVDDSRHKRRLSRELVQHKQPHVCIQAGQFSGQN